MKTAEDWADHIDSGSYFDGFDDGVEFIRAIQADALSTVKIGIISMMGAEPWSQSQIMGDEIISRINQIMPKGHNK